KIPRPANAFILYRKDKHKEISSTNKMADNKKISQIIGRMWKHEGFEVKQRYLEMAEAEKSIHKTKYPNYKYKPRQNIKK
ncbi:sequence-specific DNA-binding high mobility group box protein, partial [Neoconidiobolus thromboides FSU 785]